MSTDALAAPAMHARSSNRKVTADRMLSRYEIFSWYELTTGAPFLKGALANFDFLFLDAHRFNTHPIFIGYAISLFRPLTMRGLGAIAGWKSKDILITLLTRRSGLYGGYFFIVG